MKCKRFVFLIAIACFNIVLSMRSAAAAGVELVQEGIESYVSNIVVNVDNSIDVTETIIYDTGAEARHGIYRDIYPYSSQERKMAIEDVRVVDEFGAPYTVDISRSGKNVRIKIGDPDTTFVGQKTYLISYRATHAVGQLDDVDEIYWNVTGDQWNMPIEHVEAFVTLPSGAQSVQSACYFGPRGSTEACALTSSEHAVYTFELPYSLRANEGFTVAVGFAKGIVTPYTTADNVSTTLEKYLPWGIGITLPLVTFVLSVWYWHAKGRDPKGRGVIIPQYDVPDQLTPMEVVGIAQEAVTSKHISAEIVYLATRGYLRIHQLEARKLGFIKTTDYELTKLKDVSELSNDFDQRLLSGLFVGSATSVKLSDLKNVFYKHVPSIVVAVLDALMFKKYYKNLGKMSQSASWSIVLFFVLVWGAIFFGSVMSSFIVIADPIPIVGGFVLSVLIYGTIFYFSPAKTEKGVAAKEHILGLKEYLQIAEKDRAEFHNAPEKKPEVFERFLPYAMVLGVTAIWAKEFDGIYKTPPSWYAGPTGDAFNVMIFVHSLNTFSSFTTSSLTSSPRSSGSGGGGFSGGGGGGGGGGGW